MQVTSDIQIIRTAAEHDTGGWRYETHHNVSFLSHLTMVMNKQDRMWHTRSRSERLVSRWKNLEAARPVWTIISKFILKK